ncbi:F-BAR domain only protein 1 isoform X2 [Oryctolagus cuniculus]|uniref:F-BAR domain only protein 1 isoform X2 n=1 Tax=Oryctolagus cuniculus TaxID=9986 RepID=UPI0038792067
MQMNCRWRWGGCARARVGVRGGDGKAPGLRLSQSASEAGRARPCLRAPSRGGVSAGHAPGAEPGGCSRAGRAGRARASATEPQVAAGAGPGGLGDGETEARSWTVTRRAGSGQGATRGLRTGRGDVVLRRAFLGREEPGLRGPVPGSEAGAGVHQGAGRLHPGEGHHRGDLLQGHGEAFEAGQQRVAHGDLRAALGGVPRVLRQAGPVPPGADAQAAGPHQGRAALRGGATAHAQEVQGGGAGHPGRRAGAGRRQPAAAQGPGELPEPLHGPGALAQGERGPEGGGQETKTKKAAEGLRRSVEKYNAARADFERKMAESALRFQAMEETHLRHMKTLLGSYAHAVEDTHVQIGQVHEEFKQNVENVSVETLLRKFAESRGTGRERPGALDFEAYSAAALQEAMKRLRGAKAFRLPGLSRREREPRAALDSLEPDSGTCPEVDEEGFTVRPDLTQSSAAEPARSSSSDSDFDDEEPRKFCVHIRPAAAPAPPCSPAAAAAQLRATAGGLILPPGPAGTMRRPPARDAAKPQRPRSAPRSSSCAEKPPADEQVPKSLFGPPLESAFDHEDFTGSSGLGLTSSPSPFSSSSPENVEDSGLDSPSHAATGPSPESWVPRPGTPQSPPTCRAPPPDSPQHHAPCPGPWGPEPGSADPTPAPAEGTTRRPRKKAPRPLTRSNGDLSHSLSPSPLGPAAERPRVSHPGHGVSRGPSPVVLGSHDALPVATAFTEYVHACFGGPSPSCLARVTGELTMTFPAGITRVFSGTPPPPVLSFRLTHAARIEHFQPNAELLFSDPSQSDPETKDFWLNMAALTEALQRQAEQNPAASYHNLVLLRYQFSRPGPQCSPLHLSAQWQCGATLTQVSVEYGYRPGATAVPTPLTNVQILLPVAEPVTGVRLQPAATWNLDEKRLVWKLPDVSEAGGSGRLSASWEPLSGPSTPSPVAAQFTSEGATLSGVDVELVGSGYRMSLVKRRFATGMYVVSS